MTKATDEREAERKSAETAQTAPSAVDETVQVEIGVRLKAYYDNITREPVPDRFLELLGELDEVDAPASTRPSDED